MTAENVFLIEPDQEPPPDRVEVAGHFQFYLDTTSSEPLLITASKTASVPIPATATPGDHKLICRVHKHDGTPTSATFEISIKISGSVTTGEAGSGATTDTNAMTTAMNFTLGVARYATSAPTRSAEAPTTPHVTASITSRD